MLQRRTIVCHILHSAVEYYLFMELLRLTLCGTFETVKVRGQHQEAGSVDPVKHITHAHGKYLYITSKAM